MGKQVVAFSIAEGWSRDASEDIAHAVLERARAEALSLSRGTQQFIEGITDEELEPELCS